MPFCMPYRRATALSLLSAVMLCLPAYGAGNSASGLGSDKSTRGFAFGSPEAKKPFEASAGKGEHKAKPPTAMSVLSGQPVSLVNTTTQGAQVLRSVGSFEETGYTVAWFSGADKIFIQRFDNAGWKIGSETQLQLDIKDVSALTRAEAISSSSVAVLRDGSVVVSYRVARPVNPLEPRDQSLKNGVYVQRFDARGAQVLTETEVFSQTFVPNYRSPKLDDVKTIALADGGFATAWAAIQFSSVTIRTTFSVRRYNGSGQATGPAAVVGAPNSPGSGESTYALRPDALGGYWVSASQQREDYTPLFSLTYFDTGNAPQPITLPGGTTGAFLLPLEGENFVLFAQGSLGASRQFLDSLGNPVGPQTFISSLPVTAQELTDGSYVTFTAIAAGALAQRFDSQGLKMGESALINTQSAPVAVVALPQNGFAAAWTGAGTGTGSDAVNGQDVFAQRFTTFVDSVQCGVKAKRKACRESAASQGLKGKARKQFMDACMQS